MVAKTRWRRASVSVHGGGGNSRCEGRAPSDHRRVWRGAPPAWRPTLWKRFSTGGSQGLRLAEMLGKWSCSMGGAARRLGVRSKLCVVLLAQQVAALLRVSAGSRNTPSASPPVAVQSIEQAARSAPDPFGDLADQPELRGLLLLRQLVADDRRPKTALRAQCQTLMVDVAARLLRLASWSGSSTSPRLVVIRPSTTTYLPRPERAAAARTHPSARRHTRAAAGAPRSAGRSARAIAS